MPFTSQQQKAIDSRGKNVLVSASAGSGKTSVLVERLCQLVISDRISIDTILAMTFTNDAAAEMKDRLRQRLLQEKQTDYIRNQLAVLETADICTIDSFCLKIVQNYYYQIPISLKMANNIASDAQKQQLFQDAYETALENVSPKHLLRFFALLHPREPLHAYVSTCVDILAAKADPAEWMAAVKNDTLQTDGFDWFLLFYRQHVQAMMDICEKGKEIDTVFSRKINYLRPLLTSTYKDFISLFKVYYAQAGYMRVTKSTQDKETYNALKKVLKVHEKAIAEHLFDEQVFETDHRTMKPVRDEFCDLVLETQKQFRLKKQENELIDFTDMESMAHQLLQNEVIRTELYDHYQMILVDEFQDTNDLQESIIDCIAHDTNVFRVGDIKQSIYGFRQAKPEIMREHMKHGDEEVLIMNKNFRSSESIINFNNDFYQKIMNSDLLERQFEDHDYAYAGMDLQADTPQFPVRFLYTEVDSWASDHDMSKRSASSLHRINRYDMIANDILIHHKNGVPFKEICILTRSHSPQQEIIDCLRAYDIPVVSDLAKGFYQNAAIQIIVSTLMALQDPGDDISLCAALLSPLIQITNEQLTQAVIQKKQKASLYETIRNMEWMKEWHALEPLRYLPPCQALMRLYGVHDFYFKNTTTQDKTNLDHLLEQSVAFDSMKAFVRYLQQNSDQDAIPEAVRYGKQDDVVQIKTMHHSKGLQFPIVYIVSSSKSIDHDSKSPILIDPDLGISVSGLTEDGKIVRPSKSHIAMLNKKLHDELKEEMRVFYVATTRPKQELIFVDAVQNVDVYTSGLDTASLLAKGSYTSWLFHTYFNDPHSLVKFEKLQDLYQRPEAKDPVSRRISHPLYTKEVQTFHDLTASSLKSGVEWKPFEIIDSTAMSRGTLFHEIMGQCAFPYQEDEIRAFARSYRYSLTHIDLRQLLQINEEPLYQDWMHHKHEFECSYIIQDQNTVMHGFMDLVVWLPDQIVILDFKTDRASKEELMNLYHKQLDTYKKSMRLIDDTKPIHTWIYSFHLNQLIPLNTK